MPRCCDSAPAQTAASPTGWASTPRSGSGRCSDTLQTAIEAPEYPGRKFVVQCSDVATAVATLARADARMLGALAWRGTEVERVMARWRPEQYVEISARQVARANPWAGLPGCVYLGNAATDTGAAGPRYFVAGDRSAGWQLCGQPAMLGVDLADAGTAAPTGLAGEATAAIPVDDGRWSVPPSLSVMLRPLATLQRPTGSLYRLYTDAQAVSGASPTSYRYGANRIEVGGNPIDVGFSIDLTIDPQVQALAQRIAACYTGRQDVCRALGVQRREDAAHAIGHRMLEQAMVRMAGIAVIDVATGRIEALAGALSPCTREEYDGPGRSPKCDKRLPYPIRYRPDALLNPAVYHDAMPASVIKPIMAAAFLSDPAVGARWLAAEQTAMQLPGVAGAGQPARPADALELGTFPRSDVLRRPGLPALRTAVGSAGGGAGLRLERRLRRRRRQLR